MARTKASVGAKVAAGKSSKARCSVAPPSSSNPGGSEKSRRDYSGGNPVCPRETPKWQKPITTFFISKEGNHSKDVNHQETDEEVEQESSASTTKTKTRRVIESDSEDEQPVNRELNETINLEPLTGEDSHKIMEYYPKNGKGKGVGKKTKDKENVSNNVNHRRNSKRELEVENDDRKNKRVKVDE